MSQGSRKQLWAGWVARQGGMVHAVAVNGISGGMAGCPLIPGGMAYRWW